jgi:carbon-monoxide dehydrogenase large subunit
MDRAVDLFAAEIGAHPLEVRRRNLLRADELPWQSPTGLTYDSGDYHRALHLALEAAGYEELRAEQEQRRRSGAHLALGIGMSVFIDRTAGVPGSEYGAVELRADGSALVHTGSSPYGQGHHTAWAMLVADRTGIAFDRIEVVHGDTDVVPRGGITGGSRSAQKAGSAVIQATDALVVEARRRAADLLEADEADVVLDLAEGRFHVTGAPNAASATGRVELQRMVTVDDAGTILNPMLALGQVHGGLAQGIAQGMFEEFVYDAEGNPLTATFADYGIPSAADLPSFTCSLTETPSPNNPMGFKGIAESGTIGAPPAVQNAVIDALAHLGVRHLDLPITPERVWRAIQNGRDVR